MSEPKVAKRIILKIFDTANMKKNSGVIKYPKFENYQWSLLCVLNLYSKLLTFRLT